VPSSTPPLPSVAVPEQGRARNDVRRRRIGEVLVGQGLLTDEQVSSLLAMQSVTPAGQPRKRLGNLVIETGMATEGEVAEALAEALSLPLVDLGRTVVQPDAVRLLPRAVAERAGVLVVASERGGASIRVATADPTNVVALDDVKLYTGAAELHVLVATESQVRNHLARSWSLSEDSSDVSTLFEGVGAEEVEVEEVSVQGVEAAPIVRLVDVVLADAVRARASDVHVEPQVDELRIRYRVDGLLRDVMTVPRNAAAATVSRIKIVSGLDIAERRRPQDGRAKLTVDGMVVEARISTLPTLHGEKVVIRLLPRSDNVPQLELGGRQTGLVELLEHALAQAQGLVLITGPTGSGKTNTLYAGIQQVSTPDRNIVTLEDPVEVQVRGITQVQVQEKAGLTFARGLRSILRQDPDIVLVGEVRDQETAELALQASLTGHLVLTTLHTNDAVAAVTRLVDMGVEPFLVASSLSLVVAQRLVRRPCAGCAAPYVPSERTLALLGISEAELATATPVRGRGCADCSGTGYRGRVGVFEVLPVTAQMRQMLLTTPTEEAIGAAARAHGMLTLRASALAAAHRGATTYEEVLRATHLDTVSGPRCPSCARALADGMLCCPYDGTPVGRDRCTGCDKPLDPEWSTCPWCRTAVVVHVADGDQQADEPDEPDAGGGEDAEAVPARVLVVDADPEVSARVEQALGTAVEVVHAVTAEDALALVAQGQVEVVLVADQLPDLPGLDLVRLLQAEHGGSAPALLLRSDDDDADEARSAASVDTVATALAGQALADRLRPLLANRS
jgi:type IV pilus assembly protein PilB